MGKKLLVADDSVTIQKVVKLALASEDYEIVTVSDGKGALQQILEESQNQRPFAAVLVDANVPNLSVVELIERAQSTLGKSAPRFILLASAFEKKDSERERRLQSLALFSKLVKPFDPSHLRKAVQKAMDDYFVTHAANATSTESSLIEQMPNNNAQVPSASLVETAQPPNFVDIDVAELTTESTLQSSSDSDIKSLTDSTMRLSGFTEDTDLGWSLDDSKHLKVPEERPSLQIARPVMPAAMPPSGPPSVLPVMPPSIPPPFADIRASNELTARGVHIPTRILDDGVSSFPIDGLATPPSTPPTLQGASVIDSRQAFEASKNQSAGMASSFNKSEMEALVRREVEAAVQRLAKDLVPRIAENIIRTEIDRILSDGV